MTLVGVGPGKVANEGFQTFNCLIIVIEAAKLSRPDWTGGEARSFKVCIPRSHRNGAMKYPNPFTMRMGRCGQCQLRFPERLLKIAERIDEATLSWGGCSDTPSSNCRR